MNKNINQPDPNKHFDSVAQDYNTFRTLDIEPIVWLAQTLPTNEYSICDLGCGTGRYTFTLAQEMETAAHLIERVFGIDPAPNMIKEAMAQSETASYECRWIEASSEATKLPSHSVSLVTSFNSIHYLPVQKTLDEVCRILKTGGYCAIYTRLREQELEHIWGRWFPGYLDHSLVPTRSYMKTLPKLNHHFQLEAFKDFRFPREANFDWICEQTSNKFYSTFDRYSQEEFDHTYKVFITNLKANYRKLNKIKYWSSYSFWLYKLNGF